MRSAWRALHANTQTPAKSAGVCVLHMNYLLKSHLKLRHQPLQRFGLLRQVARGLGGLIGGACRF